MEAARIQSAATVSPEARSAAAYMLYKKAAGNPDGGKFIGAGKIADHKSVDRVVKLLQDISEDQRQGKVQELTEVLREKSMTAAAEKLGYTLSGISRSMMTLEKEAGFQLLQRKKSGSDWQHYVTRRLRRSCSGNMRFCTCRKNPITEIRKLNDQDGSSEKFTFVILAYMIHF